MSGMDYDYYNREERALCSHLFRLLHEWITPEGNKDLFIRFLNQSGLVANNGNLGEPRIYTEVALIRDSYYHRKPDVVPFMDDLAREIVQQEGLH